MLRPALLAQRWVGPSGALPVACCYYGDLFVNGWMMRGGCVITSATASSAELAVVAGLVTGSDLCSESACGPHLLAATLGGGGDGEAVATGIVAIASATRLSGAVDRRGAGDVRLCAADATAQSTGGARIDRGLQRGLAGGGAGSVFSQRLAWVLPPWGVPVAAFLGASAVTGTLLLLASRGRLDNVRLLLLGVAIGICGSAITTWLLYFSNDQSLREIMFWMMGSLAYGQAQPAWWWLPYLAVMGWLLLRRDSLNLLQLGDEQAQLMGVALRRLRWQLVLAVCLLSGFAVALAGSIGFIGLLIPHLMRLLGRGSARFVLVASLLAGASTLLLADLLSRNLLPSGELPVGILTASLGAPLLIYLLVRRHA